MTTKVPRKFAAKAQLAGRRGKKNNKKRLPVKMSRSLDR
jgi:hypothetical protein